MSSESSIPRVTLPNVVQPTTWGNTQLERVDDERALNHLSRNAHHERPSIGGQCRNPDNRLASDLIAATGEPPGVFSRMESGAVNGVPSGTQDVPMFPSRREMHTNPRKRKIVIPDVLSDADALTLASLYPEYELDFTRFAVTTHPFYSASRKCELFALLRHVGYEDSVTLSGYHDYICDVGGDFATHALANRTQIHSCCPLLDIRDAQRQVTREERMLRQGIRTFVNEDGKPLASGRTNFCNNRAQNCFRTARYLIFLHSSYDISLQELAKTMINKRSTEAYAVMMYTDKIFLEKEAYFLNNTAHYKMHDGKITFTFVDDNSLAYTHDIDNYMSYFMVSQFYYDSVNSFVVENIGVRGHSAFIKITRIEHSVPSVKISHSIWLPSYTDKRLVTYYDFDLKALSRGDYRKVLVKEQFFVDKELVSAVSSHCCTTSENKFRPSEVMAFISSYNGRVFFGGEVISKKSVMDEVTAHKVAYAIYFHVYCMKYCAGKVNQVLLNIVTACREQTYRGVFGRFLNRRKYLVRKIFGRDLGFVTAFAERVINFCFSDNCLDYTMFLSNTVCNIDLNLVTEVPRYLHFDSEASFIAKIKSKLFGREIEVETPMPISATLNHDRLSGILRKAVPQKELLLDYLHDRNPGKFSIDADDLQKMEPVHRLVVSRHHTLTYSPTPEKEFLFKNVLVMGTTESFNAELNSISGVRLYTLDHLRQGCTVVKVAVQNIDEFMTLCDSLKIDLLVVGPEGDYGVNISLFAKTIANRGVEFPVKFQLGVADRAFLVDCATLTRACFSSFNMVNFTKGPLSNRDIFELVTPNDYLHPDRCDSAFRINVAREPWFSYFVSGHLPLDFDFNVMPYSTDKLCLVQDKIRSGYVAHLTNLVVKDLNERKLFMLLELRRLDQKLKRRGERLSNNLNRDFELISVSNGEDGDDGGEDVVLVSHENGRPVEDAINALDHLPTAPMVDEQYQNNAQDQTLEDGMLSALLENEEGTNYEGVEELINGELLLPQLVDLVSEPTVNEETTTTETVNPDAEDIVERRAFCALALAFEPSTISPQRDHSLRSGAVPVSEEDLEEFATLSVSSAGMPNNNYRIQRASGKDNNCFFNAVMMLNARNIDPNEVREFLYNADVLMPSNLNGILAGTLHELNRGEMVGLATATRFAYLYNTRIKIYDRDTKKKIYDSFNTFEEFNVVSAHVSTVRLVHKSLHFDRLLCCTEPFRKKEGKRLPLIHGDFTSAIADTITACGGTYNDLDFYTIQCVGQCCLGSPDSKFVLCYTVDAKYFCEGFSYIPIYHPRLFFKGLTLLMKASGTVVFDDQRYRAHSVDCACKPTMLQYDVSVGAFIMCDRRRPRITDVDVIPDSVDIDVEVIEGEYFDMVSKGEGKYLVALPNRDLTLADDYRMEDKIESIFSKGSPVTIGLRSKHFYDLCSLTKALSPYCAHIFVSVEDSGELYSHPTFKPRIVLTASPTSYTVAAMKEAREYHRLQYTDAIDSLSRKHHEMRTIMKESKDGVHMELLSVADDYGLLDLATKTFLIKPKVICNFYQFGVTDNNGVVDLRKFINNDDTSGDPKAWLLAEHSGVVSVSKSTHLMNALVIYDRLKEQEAVPSAYDIEFVEGVPGCGKTTYIVENHDHSADLKTIVLSSGRESIDTLRSRVEEKFKVPKGLSRKKYRTIDSFLMHFKKSDYAETECIWVDEAIMKHYGDISWAAKLAGATKLILIGDSAQIPFSSRVTGLITRFGTIDLDFVSRKFLSTTYRCPVDVAVKLNEMDIYTEKVKSASVQRFSLNGRLISGIAEAMQLSSEDPDAVYLTFTQDEKNDIKTKYKRNVYTVHEYQGNQAKHIILIRLQNKPISIYTDDKYILVAITRHLVRLDYYTVVFDKTYGLVTTPCSQVQLDECSKVKGGGVAPMFLVNPAAPQARNSVFQDKKLYSFVNANLNPNVESYTVETREIPLHLPEHPVVESTFEGDATATIQTYYDLLLPNNSTENMHYDPYLFETQPMELNTKDKVRITTFNVFPTPRFDALRPNLRTSCPNRVRNSTKMVIKSFFERNGNVPQLCGQGDTVAFAKFTVSKFKEAFVGNRLLYDTFKDNPIRPSVASMQEWLTTQPPSVPDLLQLDDGFYNIYYQRMNSYSLILKNLPKPKTEIGAQFTFPAPQTIAHQGKKMNGVFCPIIKECKRRLLSVLKTTVLINTDLSVDEFEKILTARLSGKNFFRYKKMLEIDAKKYDKSQDEKALWMEVFTLLELGFPQELVPVWLAMHTYTTLTNFTTRFKAQVSYQRKSGDADTFFGNTLLLMNILNMSFKLWKIKFFGMFAGDDSTLLVEEYNSTLDATQYIENSFNISTKLLTQKTIYFCSKFFCYTPWGTWVIIPDPLKVMTKLGRRDLVNWQHMEEYRISLSDLLKNFGNEVLYPLIDICINDRYKTAYPGFAQLYRALYFVVSDQKNFSKLFYHREGEILDLRTVQLPKNDL